MPTDILVRLARRDERQALEELQRRASLEWDDHRADLLAHPDAIALPVDQIEAERVHVAELKGRIGGFCVVLSRPDGDAELDGLFVEPDAWRQGIGRRLADEAAKVAAAEQATWLYVIAGRRALPFYAACAFAMFGETSTRFDPAFIMRKQVRPDV